MKTKRTKYLSYVEQTPKHFSVLEGLAKVAARKAVEKTRAEHISFVYLEGDKIIREESGGIKTEISRIPKTSRVVYAGEKFKLS